MILKINDNNANSTMAKAHITVITSLENIAEVLKGDGGTQVVAG